MKNPDPSIMLVADKVCKNCLLGTHPVVCQERVDEILEDLNNSGRAFVCHVASIAGEVIICRSFYEQQRSLVVRLARILNRVKFVPLPKGVEATE